MKTNLLVALVLVLSTNVNSQSLNSEFPNFPNVVNFEILGFGGLYSINYERVLGESVVLRGGLSYVQFDGFLNVEGFSFPLSTTYLIPIDYASYFEIGVFSTLKTFYLSDVWIGPSIGFRQQDFYESDWVLKVSFSARYSTQFKNIKPIIGLSFGRSF